MACGGGERHGCVIGGGGSPPRLSRRGCTWCRRLYTRPGEYAFETQWYLTALTNVKSQPVRPEDHPLPGECKLPAAAPAEPPTDGSAPDEARSLASLGRNMAPYVIPPDEMNGAAASSMLGPPATAGGAAQMDDCTPTVAVAGTHAYLCADGYIYTISATPSCAERGGCGLVVDYHGTGMDGDTEDKGTDMRAQATARGYVVVQPTVCYSINASRQCGAAVRGLPEFMRLFRVVDELQVGAARGEGWGGARVVPPNASLTPLASDERRASWRVSW